MRLAALAATGVAALGVVGCGGEEASPPAPDPGGTGYFVGEGGGLSAAVDLRARGRELGLVRRSVGVDRAVAVGAVVNDSGASRRAPRFRAILDDGSSIRLASVGPPQEQGGGPAPPPPRLPAGAARMLYLVFPAGAPAERTVAIRMTPHGEAAATLRPRER